MLLGLEGAGVGRAFFAGALDGAGLALGVWGRDSGREAGFVEGVEVSKPELGRDELLDARALLGRVRLAEGGWPEGLLDGCVLPFTTCPSPELDGTFKPAGRVVGAGLDRTGKDFCFSRSPLER